MKSIYAGSINACSTRHGDGLASTDGINTGCRFIEIRQLIPQLLGNVRHWIENKTYGDIDEIAVRFHHRLGWQIHAFLDGNGLHARLLADVLVAKHGARYSPGGQRAHT